MICTAISEKNPGKCLCTLDHAEMAEIRLDLTDFDADEIREIFAHPTPTIATCRPDVKGNEYQLMQLTAAIEAGANYVDIEIEAEHAQQEAIIKIALNNNCKVIISYHNYNETPGLRKLFEIADLCYNLGADIAKIATFSKSKFDNARLLALYSIEKPIVALGMGEEGKITRIMAPLLGAAFTFAAMDNGLATAPGQFSYSKMKEILALLNKAV